MMKRKISANGTRPEDTPHTWPMQVLSLLLLHAEEVSANLLCVSLLPRTYMVAPAYYLNIYVTNVLKQSEKKGQTKKIGVLC